MSSEGQSQRERSRALRTAEKSAVYAGLRSARGHADIHGDDSINNRPPDVPDTLDGDIYGSGDHALKRKDPLAPGPGEPISSGRIYWGMIADGQKFPHALASDRRVIDHARDLMPSDVREKCRIVRVHATLWRFDHEEEKPEPPKKRARKAP